MTPTTDDKTMVLVDTDQEVERDSISIQSHTKSEASTLDDKEISVRVNFTETVQDQSVKPFNQASVTEVDPTRFGDWEKNGRCIDF